MQSNTCYSDKSVVIVEDDKVVAVELKAHLSRLGFSLITTVDSGEQGIAIATRDRPDLVLMDIRLNGTTDGIQAVQEIYKQVDLAIVYLTAYSDRETIERVKTTQHDGFILKPFHRYELESTISVAFERHAIRERLKFQ